MRNGKNGETYRFRKPREVQVAEKQVASPMVLRSHKRKLAQIEPKNNEVLVRKKRKSSDLRDTSDCIILSDSDSTVANVNKLVTSTPIRGNGLKTANFEASRIEPSQGVQPNDKTTEIIVISDSPATALPIIVISDGDESEVEVLPRRKSKRILQIKSDEETETKKENSVPKDVINKRPCESPPKSNVANNKMRRFNSRKQRYNKWSRDHRYFKQKSKTERALPVGENIYIENPVALPKTGLRPIIIDGSNVAFHHSNNSYFSCKGLEICIKYFKNRGHEVIAFVPQYRVQSKKSDNPKLLDLLVRSGDVVLTPSRMVNGNRIVPYDDRFIVQTAVIKGGIIVTRDNYTDLLIENPSWAETIQYRLLQFTWVQDLLMFPNDPLGKRGPSLDEFLRFG